MRPLVVVSLAVLLATARLSAQVCDNYDHAMKSGWKRLSRKQFQHGIDDFAEALTTHATTDAVRWKHSASPSSAHGWMHEPGEASRDHGHAPVITPPAGR